MVVTFGLTVGLDSVLVVELMLFVHRYVEPAGPVGLPPIVMLDPSQMLWSAPASTMGNGFTVTSMVSLSIQLGPAVTVTTKEVVELGLTFGLDAVLNTVELPNARH